MANKEVYRLSINVNVTGDKKSKQKISDLEGVTEKVEKKLKKLSDITASPSAKIKDNASSTIEKVESKVKNLVEQLEQLSYRQKIVHQLLCKKL